MSTEIVTETATIPVPGEHDSILVHWHIPRDELDKWCRRLGLTPKRNAAYTNGVNTEFWSATTHIRDMRVMLYSNNEERRVEVSVHRA